MLADRMLGKLIDRLKRFGLYDRSLLVITSDHGISFRAGHFHRSVRRNNIGDVGLVPFIVKAPGQTQGRSVGRQLQSTDVLPTLAQLIGVKLRGVDGRPAQELPGPGRQTVEDFQRLGGVEVRAPFSLLIRERRQTLRRKIRLFGVGQPGRSFYGIGQYRALVGSKVSGLAPTSRNDLVATLDHAADYRAVDPSSYYIPALVSGEIDGPSAGTVRNVAIAVNGRIEAVAPTHPIDGTRFWAMLPQRSLRSGENSVAVYSIVGSPKSPKLLGLGGVGR
jgi:sulfatase-like protein